MGDIKIVGMEKLQKKLKKNVNMDDVKKKVRQHGGQLQTKAMRTADFKGMAKRKGESFCSTERRIEGEHSS